MGHHLVETDVLDSINSTQLLSLQLRKNICEIPGFADVWWIFSMGDPPLVESLGNRNIWLVVWNILNFPFHIWENPSHWLSYCSRWFFNHQPDMHTFFSIWGDSWIAYPPQKMRWFGACERSREQLRDDVQEVVFTPLSLRQERRFGATLGIWKKVKIW